MVILSFKSVLQELLSGIFDAVLSPVLRDAFNVILSLIGSLLNDIFANFFLMGWITLLKLVDFMEGIFNVFSGISNVRVMSMKNGVNVSEEMSLLSYFFQLNQIQKAFGIITGIAVVLAFLTTLISVIRSMSDMALEDKHPLSTVLKQAGKAAVNFLMIPIVCLLLLNAASSIVMAVNTSFSEDPGTVSDALFITVAGPNAKSEEIRKEYSSGLKYQNYENVKSRFNYKGFNYVQGYVSAILVMFIMLCSILQFIQRIFMILLLYLVSPFFVAFIPLDGGEKFKTWRNMFVGHMASAFGPIIVMKMYMMIVPPVVNSDIDFGVGSILEGCIKLVFIIGGAFAVYKSRLLILSLIDPQAASSAAESGIIGAIVGGKALAIFGGSVANKGNSKGKSKGSSGGSSKEASAQSAAYKGGAGTGGGKMPAGK